MRLITKLVERLLSDSKISKRILKTIHTDEQEASEGQVKQAQCDHVINPCKGFQEGRLINGGTYIRGGRGGGVGFITSASKQAKVMLIKTRFVFSGF